jgi:enoyl-CoA hydratase/carnithine racemase
MSLINLENQQDNQIAVITFNRPAVHNAINKRMIQQFRQILDEIYSDDRVRIIIIAAAGRESFCAGGDLKYFSGLTTRQQALEMSRDMQKLLNRLWKGDKVVIAAINGQALGGGCEIITACHLRICVKGARFSFRQAANGIITGWGGGLRLLQSLGRPALHVLMTSDWITADEALRMGFVDMVVDHDDLLTNAMDLARKIIKKPPAVVKSFMQLYKNFLDADPEKTVEFETETFADLWVKSDFQNWLKAYLRLKDKG